MRKACLLLANDASKSKSATKYVLIADECSSKSAMPKPDKYVSQSQKQGRQSESGAQSQRLETHKRERRLKHLDMSCA